jgi:hypothetical protein
MFEDRIERRIFENKRKEVDIGANYTVRSSIVCSPIMFHDSAVYLVLCFGLSPSNKL